jgi:hypothetical protein
MARLILTSGVGIRDGSKRRVSLFRKIISGGKTGDIIDLYKNSRPFRYTPIDGNNTEIARFLIQAADEGALNLNVRLEENVPSVRRRRKADETSGFEGIIDADWEQLKRIKSSKSAIAKFKGLDVNKLPRVPPSSAIEMWYLLHQDYPADSVHPVSNDKRGYWPHLHTKSWWIEHYEFLEEQASVGLVLFKRDRNTPTSI